MLDARLIGSYISRLRKEADLTQSELSDRLNVTHQAVSKWERGESLPDIGTLMELAKVFIHFFTSFFHASLPPN